MKSRRVARRHFKLTRVLRRQWCNNLAGWQTDWSMFSTSSTDRLQTEEIWFESSFYGGARFIRFDQAPYQ
jgi:hypothetical protein